MSTHAIFYRGADVPGGGGGGGECPALLSHYIYSSFFSLHPIHISMILTPRDANNPQGFKHC